MKRTSIRLISVLLALMLSGGMLLYPHMRPAQSAAAPAEISLAQDKMEPIAPEEHTIIMKESGGTICIFEDGVLVQDTGIPVFSLPLQDREALAEGIAVNNTEDLCRLLEDLGS